MVSVWALLRDGIAQVENAGSRPTMDPGGNPVIDAAGHTPTLPVMMPSAPVYMVTLGVAPRTANLHALPRSWADAGAETARKAASYPRLASRP